LVSANPDTRRLDIHLDLTLIKHSCLLITTTSVFFFCSTNVPCRFDMACQRCHQKKIRCTGGDASRNFACRHCLAARTACTYPTRDRNVTVSETYLKALESAVTQLTPPEPAPPRAASPRWISPSATRSGPPSSKRRFIEDTTGDAFILRLKNLAHDRQDAAGADGEGDSNVISPSRDQGSTLSYEYFSLPSDQQSMLWIPIMKAPG
jgi:proline utilization trans-activator